MSLENQNLGGDTKNITLDVAPSSLQAVVQTPKLPELTFPIKKDLASLFVRDITKKHVDAVSNKIKLLEQELRYITVNYQKKIDIVSPFPHKIIDTQLALDQNLEVFKQKIAMSGMGISFEDVVFLVNNNQKKIETITSISQLYLDALQKENASLAKGEKYSQEEIDQNFSTYTESLYMAFDSFAEHQLSHVSLQMALDSLNQQQIVLENELSELDKDFNRTSLLVEDTLRELEKISKEGFLATFEFFDDSLKIDQLVSQKKVHDKLQKIISLYAKKDEFVKYNITPPKSILLSGPKETGKTFAAKVLAAETDRTMYHIKHYDVFSEDATDPNQMLSDIFYTIIEHVQEQEKSCVVFLDEIEKMIDSVGKANGVAQQIIINTIEKNLLAIKKSDLDIIVVAAFGSTDKNNINTLDKKVFDENIQFDLPNPEELQAVFLQNVDYYPDVVFVIEDYDLLLKKCAGMSASYIHTLIKVCATDFSFYRIDGDTSFVVDQKYILAKHEEFQSQSSQKYFHQ